MLKLAEPMALLGKSMPYEGLENNRAAISVIGCGGWKAMRHCE